MEDIVNAENRKSGDMSNNFVKKLKSLLLFKTLPKGVFSVSLFGLFLGISTTMVYSQLGMFLKYDLGISERSIASLDGVIEFFSYLTRVFAGAFSDYLGNRKLVLLIGCFVTLLVRPLLAIATSAGMVMGALSIERIGNGLQASPRDALIADLSSKSTHAQSFGFCRSLKTCGALLGTSLAIGVMYFSSDNYRLVFFCATIPVALAIVCLTRLITEKKRVSVVKKMRNPFSRKHLKSFDAIFWKVILLAFLFELGHFSESLLPLRGHDFVSKTYSGSTGIFTTIGQIVFAYPIGFFADRIGKKYFIRVCMLVMFLANLCLLSATSISFVYLGALLWGCQLSATQGLFLSVISEHVDKELRGTAIGIFYCALGVAYLAASWIAGSVWTSYGSSYAFIYSMVISLFCFFIAPVLFSNKGKANAVYKS